MPDSLDSSWVEIDRIIDRLSAIVPLEVVLAVAIGATLLLAWWLLRKLVRLALYAGIVGAAAWLWYFGVPD